MRTFSYIHIYEVNSIDRKKSLYEQKKKAKNILTKICFSYRGIRETIPAVIELNESLKRGIIFPR